MEHLDSQHLVCRGLVPYCTMMAAQGSASQYFPGTRMSKAVVDKACPFPGSILLTKLVLEFSEPGKDCWCCKIPTSVSPQTVGSGLHSVCTYCSPYQSHHGVAEGKQLK